ncbi:MAG: thioesterase [Alistipes sp.]
MADKISYDYMVDSQEVDFTLRATVSSIVNAILGVAGVDARQRGFGVEVLNEQNYSWVLSRMAIELESRPLQFTMCQIETWINTYSRVLSTRNFMLTDAKGKVFGRAVTQWCMIDLTARTPVDLTKLVDEHNQSLVDRPSPIDKPRKIVGVHPQQTAEHRVVYSDIDYNQHVNTLRYVDMIFDRLPLSTFDGDGTMRMDIHFIHECRYGQLLTVGYEQRERLSLFEIQTEEGVAAVRASVEWR